MVKEKRKRMSTNVMIVEDEKDLCYLFEIMLKKQNLTTACVNTLAEAKEIINYINPNILFVDNNLPDGSRTDFISQVKLLYPAIKIIMITAYDTPKDIEKAFHTGVDYFISKPFTSITIKNVLLMFELGNTG